MAVPAISFRDLSGKHGPLLAAVIAMLAFLATPVDRLVRKLTSGREEWCLDAFHLACLVLPVLLLLLTRASPWWFLLAAPWVLVRLADLQFIYLRSFVFDLAPRSKPRVVLHLFMHYTEVVLLFSLAYLLLQAVSSADDVLLFEKATDDATALTAWQALFFSFVSAATIGFGDIAPNHEHRFAWIVYLLTWAMTFMLLSFTLVELARVLGHPAGKQAGASGRAG